MHEHSQYNTCDSRRRRYDGQAGILRPGNLFPRATGQRRRNCAQPAGYADGDLVLAFMNAADATPNGNVLFDLGSASSFTGLAAGTYSVAGFNGSATAGQPTPGFGTSTVLSANESVPSANTFWAVMGSLPSSVPSDSG